MMRERPILFSGEMVRAILDGRKTQTRRVMKPQPFSNGIKYIAELGDIVCHDDYLPPSAMLLRAGSKKHPYNSTQDEWPHICPYGQPGDRLWVRETWQPIWAEFDKPPWGDGPGNGWAVRYPATDGIAEYHDNDTDEITQRCRPSIHMPRWASRITLEVTGVRIERLQDISENDARAEGVAPVRCSGTCDHDPCHMQAFEDLWNHINGAGAWDLNPYVWVLEFKRVAQEVRAA